MNIGEFRKIMDELNSTNDIEELVTLLKKYEGTEYEVVVKSFLQGEMYAIKQMTEEIEKQRRKEMQK